MVAAVGTRVTQAALLASTAPANDLRVTTGAALVALNYPSPFVRTTQVSGLVTTKSAVNLRVTQAEANVSIKSDSVPRVSQAAVLVATRGRINNPKLRAWTFSLDGHDFYVLRLGVMLTLVYDVYSEQWMDWDAFSESYWPVMTGINWFGGTGLADKYVGGTDPTDRYGSNVLVGDDTYGLLWILNPDQPWDQSPEVLEPQQEVFFPRAVMGQVPMVGREVEPCYAVWLTTDMGDPAYVGAGVNLSISDDGGKTFDDMGTVTVTTGENSPELSWYSLGQIVAPGRLFLIVDDGAITRIDRMEMNDPDDK